MLNELTGRLLPTTLICCALLKGALATAQEGHREDLTLQLTGPAGQTLIVVCREFSNGQVRETVTHRLSLDGEGAKLSLGKLVDDARVFVVVPTLQPVTANLLRDGENLVSTSSNLPQTLELRIGQVPSDDSYEPPRSTLDQKERDFINHFFETLGTAEQREIVSRTPLSNIDWQTLQAYCRALLAEMGTLSPATLALDGWLGWDGTLGVRVLSGFAYFQGGKVRFTLMVDEDSLVDVRVEAPRMPPDWFQGPSSTDEYAEQARMLVQSVFAGDIDAAHQLFSRRYQPLVTREILQELSSKIRSDLGNEITKTSLQGTSVAPTATDEGGMTLTVAHLLVTTDGKECISHVNFVFPVGGNTISRGHLASIFVRKSWTTSHPQLVQLTEQTLMHALQPTAEKGQFLEEFQQYFHPGVVPHLRTTGLADRLTQAQDEWQGMDGTADWNAWQVEIVGENLSAVGWVPVARHGYLEEGPSQGCVEAKLDFSDGKLIGLTLVGPSFSFSTLNMVEGLGSTAEVGRLFWGEVLRGRADAAHQRMSQALRTQLPLADFEKIVDDAKLTQAAQLQSIELNAVRYCDRINRQQAIMFSCYYVAVRTDGSSQPLQCDFAVSDDESDKSLALMNFNADFTHNFPVDGEAVGQRVLTSFISGVPQAVIELVAPEDRREIDERLLRIFLSQLKMQLATTELPIRYSLMNIYSPNGCGQELRTAFDSGEAALPFSANLKRGQLKAFHFSSPKLSRFVEHLEDREVITNVAEQFLNQWLNDNDLEMAAGRLVPALRTAATAQRLTALRTSLNPVSEDKITFHLASWDLHETENRIITEFEIFGVPQEKRIELVIEVDAFAARIYSIRVVESQR